MWDVIVIGGGPAGMMAAARAAERGRSVLLLEKKNRLGTKLSITGGGRCNVTNHTPEVRAMLEKYRNSGKFLFSTFTQHGVVESIAWFAERGVSLVEENEGRLFPDTHSAETICETLRRELAKQNVSFQLNAAVEGVVFDESATEFVVSVAGGKCVRSRACVMATGGTSRPETGSTGEGFSWLASLGHTVRENDYSLVPVVVRESWVNRVSGVTLGDVKIMLYADGDRRGTKRGKVLFTHVGLSGPTILNMSREIGELLRYSDVVIKLDLFPDQDEGMLRTFLNEQFAGSPNRNVRNILATIVPRALATVLLEQCEIDPDTPAHSVRKEERARLVSQLKQLPLAVQNLLGADKAVISSGGVDLTEIDFKTMGSRLVPGLHIIGDLLDIDRPSGGYSLQLCWSTGFVAGSYA